MTAVFAVVLEVLREALSRKWFLAIGILVSLGLAFAAIGIRLDAVDTAIAASGWLKGDAGALALGPIYSSAVAAIYFGWLTVGTLLCSGFAPGLLAPGRVEHLLALPVRRWELLVGSFIAVLTLLTLGALYASGGLSLILGLRTGQFSLRPIMGALMAIVAFAPVYALMLLTSVFVRSAPACTFAGAGLIFWGILSSYRDQLSMAFDTGLGRTIWKGLTAPFPRIASLGTLARQLAAGEVVEIGPSLTWVGGALLFALAMLVLAIARFDGKDY